MKEENSRRSFLKNTSLAALGLGLAPALAKASPIQAGSETMGGGCAVTTLDAYGQGPFYTANAPVLSDNSLAASEEVGTRLTITGRVKTLDCLEFIENAIIDVWQANDAGAYDNVGYNLRGKVSTNSQGFYTFETIFPGKYLNGATYRPAHIHFKITPPGYPTLTTQLYFEGDEDIPADAAASITSGQYDATHRIIPVVVNENGGLDGVWDIIVDGDGTNGIRDIHLEHGMIYKSFPNPFQDRLEINYGVFKSAKVGLLVFDMNGTQVATLEDKIMTAEKHQATWQPEAYLPSGTYFVVLRVNDMQVHYVKVVKA